jgi:hypothetical protein
MTDPFPYVRKPTDPPLCRCKRGVLAIHCRNCGDTCKECDRERTYHGKHDHVAWDWSFATAQQLASSQAAVPPLGIPEIKGAVNAHIENATESGDYYGQAAHEKPNGTGYFKSSNGTEYYGEWKNGIRNGPGNMRDANGNVFDGTWYDGLIQGYSTINYNTGDSFEGYFINSEANGLGILTSSDGTTTEGIWEEKGGQVQLVQKVPLEKRDGNLFVIEPIRPIQLFHVTNHDAAHAIWNGGKGMRPGQGGSLGGAVYTCFRPWDCVNKSIGNPTPYKYLLELAYTPQTKEVLVLQSKYSSTAGKVGPPPELATDSDGVPVDAVYVNNTSGLEFAIFPGNEHRLQLVACYLIKEKDSAHGTPSSYGRWSRRAEFEHTNRKILAGQYYHQGVPLEIENDTQNSVKLIDEMPLCNAELRGEVCMNKTEYHNMSCVHSNPMYKTECGSMEEARYYPKNLCFTTSHHGYLGKSSRKKYKNKKVSRRK